MKKTLYDYKEAIMKLPLKNKYTKEELLIKDFLVDSEKNIEIYYAPHNEYLNPNAKVFIIGITPGFQQMSTAIATARKELEVNDDIQEIQYKCKVAGRFSGSLRKNIISMLDGIELNKALELQSCSELFEDKDYLLHTISLIPYSVFVNKENYSGHTPKLMKSDFLMKYVYENFISEFKNLNNPENILLIPLGKAVEEVLIKLREDGVIKENQILVGFPHPSGANVNRLVQFEKNKDNMIKFIKSHFDF
ncbi:hypothetical protein [Clostridium sp.]|uniref:hypothetical protein n=1 Tax=Clostridium sp. TaxID=1506 RepID=UPI0025E2DC33|nr:hypothetical protein [uncultured Clostridium sp.]